MRMIEEDRDKAREEAREMARALKKQQQEQSTKDRSAGLRERMLTRQVEDIGAELKTMRQERDRAVKERDDLLEDLIDTETKVDTLKRMVMRLRRKTRKDVDVGMDSDEEVIDILLED